MTQKKTTQMNKENYNDKELAAFTICSVLEDLTNNIDEYSEIALQGSEINDHYKKWVKKYVDKVNKIFNKDSL